MNRENENNFLNPFTDTDEELKLKMRSFFNNKIDKENLLSYLNKIIAHNYHESIIIIALENSIKITYKEANKFTIVQLFFEKSKIIVRYNLKSFDHLTMSEPDLEFVNVIITGILEYGYHLKYKENDELHSTCRIEFMKEK